MIAVIDYGMGNLRSVQKALERVGGDARLVRTPDETRVRRYSQVLGGVFGLFSLVLTFVEARPTTQLGTLFTVIWVLGAFQLWAWALARLYVLAYPPVGSWSPAATCSRLTATRTWLR